jgi:hypothetical protein
MSTALRPVRRLNGLSSTPAAPSGRAPRIRARLRRLATKLGEKSGLADIVACPPPGGILITCQSISPLLT